MPGGDDLEDDYIPNDDDAPILSEQEGGSVEELEPPKEDHLLQDNILSKKRKRREKEKEKRLKVWR